MRTLKTLPARTDTNAPPGSPRPSGRWARARRAAADLTPQAIEQVAQRVAQLLRHEPPSPAGAQDDTHTARARLLTADQLARHLGLNRAWVYEHAAELGAIQLGDGPRPRLRFDAQLAAQALQARRRRNEPTAAGEKPHPRPTRRRRTPSNVPLLPVHEPRTRGIFARWHRTHGREC
jgi:hypothetical protein